ncbi:MAG: AsmA-like C-terminal region-containing protein, partial [Planctomycetota bacterium]
LPVLRSDRGKVEGTMGGNVTLSARGLGRAALRNSLQGSGTLRLRDFEVQNSILLRLLTLSVRGASYEFDDLDIAFTVAGGWVRPRPILIRGRPFDIEIKGKTHVDGRLKYVVFLKGRRLGVRLPTAWKVEGTLDKPRSRPTLRSPFD